MQNITVTKNLATENPMAYSFLDVALKEVTSSYPVEFKSIELYRLTNGCYKARLLGNVRGPVRVQNVEVLVNENHRVVRARTLD